MMTHKKTAYLRYAPDSPRFADARLSTLAKIKAGDQMRVLGNRNEDGSTIQAEKVVSGSFRQIAATITSIDPRAGELTIKDLATKKPLTVKVDADSTMKRLPEQAVRTLARRYAPGAPPTGAGNGSADIGQMLDNLPAMALSELKRRCHHGEHHPGQHVRTRHRDHVPGGRGAAAHRLIHGHARHPERVDHKCRRHGTVTEMYS
jgi:hypothetical protein